MTKDEAIRQYIQDYAIEGTVDPERTAEENYRGQFGSAAEYARQLAYDLNPDTFADLPEYVAIDWAETAKIMEAQDCFVTYPSGHIFEAAH